MNLDHQQALKKLLETPKEIAIIPHKNPDGDAIGSTLALKHFLNSKGHNASVISPNDFPKFLKWMPGADTIIDFEKQNKEALQWLQKATVIFTLDFNHLDRAGQMASVLEASTASFVMIDHHQAPADYASIMYSDVSMSSTCEMVYNVINSLGVSSDISPAIANCIYTGIMTDTGSFKFKSTTSTTHRIIASLLDKGAQGPEIHQKIYDTNSPSRLQLLGCALKNMVILEDYSTAYITLSQQELDDCHYKKGDTEGFVNYGLTLEGIKFAAIFIENAEEGIFKISFRSVGDFSVNAFSRNHFSGGGHTNAAGGKSEDSLENTISYFTSLLPLYKDQLQA